MNAKLILSLEIKSSCSITVSFCVHTSWKYTIYICVWGRSRPDDEWWHCSSLSHFLTFSSMAKLLMPYLLSWVTNFSLLVIFSVVIKREKIRMAGRWGRREKEGKGKREERTGIFSAPSKCSHSERCYDFCHPVSLETSNLTLINQANNQGASF